MKTYFLLNMGMSFQPATVDGKNPANHLGRIKYLVNNWMNLSVSTGEFTRISEPSNSMF